MASRSPSRFRSERWFALLLVIAILILSLFQLVCLIASYFPPDPYGLQRHEYGVFLPLLGGLLFSIYLLRTTREELRRPLPIAALTGLVLGLFLGCISNLPYLSAAPACLRDIRTIHGADLCRSHCYCTGLQVA